jgi:hypothetical protein
MKWLWWPIWGLVVIDEVMMVFWDHQNNVQMALAHGLFAICKLPFLIRNR